MQSRLALVGAVGAIAAMQVAKAALGFGSGGGLLETAFSLNGAPNGPATWPTIFGAGGSGLGPAALGDPGDPGEDDWLDDRTRDLWTALKNLSPAPVGMGTDLTELGPPMGYMLINVKGNNKRREGYAPWLVDHTGNPKPAGK